MRVATSKNVRSSPRERFTNRSVQCTNISIEQAHVWNGKYGYSQIYLFKGILLNANLDLGSKNGRKTQGMQWAHGRS